MIRGRWWWRSVTGMASLARQNGLVGHSDRIATTGSHGAEHGAGLAILATAVYS